MQEVNISLFQFFNAFSSFPFIAKISPFLADFPIFFLPIFLVWAWIYLTYCVQKPEQRESLMFIFYSCVIAIIISLIIQQFVDIDRPETAIVWAWKLLLEHIPDASFPSDHASVASAFLMGLWFTGYKKIFYWFRTGIKGLYITKSCRWKHGCFYTKKIDVWKFKYSSQQ